jgi:hypothetical protein
MEHTTQEISRLRRCINDLASLLGLPAMWTGQDCSRVISTLFAVLIRMLDLDFAYARMSEPGNGSPREWMRSADRIDQHTEPKEIGRALEPYLAAEMPTANFRIANPLAEDTASICSISGSRTESAYSSPPHGDRSFRPRPNVFCSRWRRTKPLSRYRKPAE